MPSGMKAVSSMLFDLEDTQDEAAGAAKVTDVASPSSRVAQLVREASESVPQVANVLAQLTQQDDLVAASQALGYSVRLRDCVGGGQGAACLQNLHHSFLILSPSAHCVSSRPPHAEEIIIDPTFRDQFVIAHPSTRYQAVLDALPPVFIGTASTVQPLVELLCAEMAAAFQAAGIVIPPWRSLRSMMTKWMPRRSLDLPLPPGACSSAAAAGHQQQASTGAAAAGTVAAWSGPTAGKRDNSSQLLRQACLGTNAHSSLGDGSTAGGMQSASSSSNCSSTSAEATHVGLLRSIAGSASGNVEPGSPTAAPAGNGTAAGARILQNLLSSPGGSNPSAPERPGKHAPLVQQAIPCPAAARRGVRCFEPLQRVVGGFGLGTTPL